MFIIYFVYLKKKSDADLEFLPVSTPFLKDPGMHTFLPV